MKYDTYQADTITMTYRSGKYSNSTMTYISSIIADNDNQFKGVVRRKEVEALLPQCGRG
jgi:hypothetical protein